MKRILFATCLLASAILFLPSAEAASYDLASLLSNPGFESGLAGWTYTGAGVNANTYLTNNEWTGQTWSSSSPFYTDAQLAVSYPGQPWGLNPAITHIEQTGGPSDPTTTLTAPVGSNFVGSRQDGYSGHYLTGGGPSDPVSYYDTNFQLRTTIGTAYQSGDVFTLTVWGNRGRLRDDWGTINANTTGNASTLGLSLFGNAAGPDYSVAQAFTAWGVDGQWASQTLTWTLDRDVTSLQLFITGQNKNHDRFVAVDLAPVPIPSAMVLLGSGLAGLVGIGRWGRRRNTNACNPKKGRSI